MLTSAQIRRRFLDYFAAHNHAILPSASLLPTKLDSATNATLFNAAGMQPLVPYLLGQEHPQGKRLASAQKCVRTIDIDEVGDNTHNTFFEMLGNWSLGDYFKKDAIAWSWDFLTDTEKGLGLDPGRLYITVFAGNKTVDKDLESVDIWKQFVPEHRIYFRDSKDNWWTAGPDSPAGPSTEMFYDTTGKLGDLSPKEFEQADEDQKLVEIWNDVFMSYQQKKGVVTGGLPHKNVDTGAGLERVATMVQGVQNIYETDIFKPVMQLVQNTAQDYQTKPARIIADHVRAILFMITDGAFPSNKDQGYIVRRLLRRAVVNAMQIKIININELFLKICMHFSDLYHDQYPQLHSSFAATIEIINTEIKKTLAAYTRGQKEFKKLVDSQQLEAGDTLGAKYIFLLYEAHGLPIEVTASLAKQLDISIDSAGFEKLLHQHQEKSRQTKSAKFAGGLADHDPKTVALHTAHHLLLAGLQRVLGDSVVQKGSNITQERLRLDVSFDRKIEKIELDEVEQWVNENIAKALPVTCKNMPKQDAKAMGAQMEFGAKYPDMVDVYTIGHPNEYVSKEFCGGPHVENTKQLSVFKIIKETASSKGVRRIKAILQ